MKMADRYRITAEPLFQKSFGFCIVFLFLSFQIHAQQNFPLDRDAVQPYDKLLNDKNVDYHTAVKPFLNNELIKVNDSSIQYLYYKARQIPDSIREKKNITTDFRPRFCELAGGYDLKNKTPVMDVYGTVGVNVYYKKKLAVVLNYMGGNSLFPGYIDTAVKSTRVVPGIGPAYQNGKSYSYQDYFGYLSYSPNRIFNFQLGKDKNFFGDGYRSMFLSDNTANYPFFKIQVHTWKIKWVNLFTQMTDATTPTGLQSNFRTKYASMQYLSWNATKRINLSLFETIVWQGNDTNRVRGFDVNYMNPVLFFRPTEYSLGSPDNALVGAAMKIKLPLQTQIYGQFLLDEFILHEFLSRSGWWGNKYSIQAGLKAFALFGINNLYAQAEFNYVRPYTYSHGSVQQNYGDFNQPLADPFGANFEEFVGILNYRVKRFIIEVKGVAAMTGLDTAGNNFGQNIFLSYLTRTGGQGTPDAPHEYDHHVGDGLKTYIGTADLRVAYLILPSMNLKAEFGLSYHTIRSVGYKPSDALIISFGLKTSLYNTYRDY
jgi:hypothetical protein